ncbi:MAG: hypothetical protein WDZ51_14795 [Pirellulaceae bacterium]
MAAGRYIRFLVQAYFSQPKHQREIYHWIRANAPVLRIAEIGIGDASRASQMIQFAKLYAEEGQIDYLGIDMFEGRPNQDGVPLKTAHKLLHSLGAKAKLVPGDAAMALPRVANGFSQVDLLIISADQDTDGVRSALSWVPRMLHEKSLVLWEVKDAATSTLTYQRLTMGQVAELARPVMARAA